MRGLSRFSSHLKVEGRRTNRKIYSDGEFATDYLYHLLHKCLSLPRHNHDVDENDGAILQACRLALYPVPSRDQAIVRYQGGHLRSSD